MEGFRRLSPEEFDVSAFRLIGKDWLLITTEALGRSNAMTASWGGMGVMWNKPVLYLVIRPQRFTRELLDENGRFSVCVLDGSRRSDYNYLGTASGRDGDKLAHTGLALAHEDGFPFLPEAHTVFLCKSLYRQPMAGQFFLESAEDARWYPDKDYHSLYVAQVERLLVKEA